MAWHVTADTSRFEEALRWFAAKAPIAADKLQALTDAAKSRAFVVAGVTKLRIVEAVYSEILHSMENGVNYETFRKSVRDRVEHTISEANLRTAFVTNVQTAYSTGRYEQMTAPEVAAVRSFWMYDATLDSHTTDLCRSLGSPAVVLPIGDPFWDTHTPPLHFNCRSGIRSLRQKQAEREGVTTTPPALSAADGFGLAPPLRAEYQPDLSQTPPDLTHIYHAEQAAMKHPPSNS